MSHDLRWPRQRPVNGENAGESPEGFARSLALDLPEGLCPKVVDGSGRRLAMNAAAVKASEGERSQTRPSQCAKL